jgi:hypothetical protein
MEDNVPCRKITFSQPEGSRKKGRRRLGIERSQDLGGESTGWRSVE